MAIRLDAHPTNRCEVGNGIISSSFFYFQRAVLGTNIYPTSVLYPAFDLQTTCRHPFASVGFAMQHSTTITITTNRTKHLRVFPLLYSPIVHTRREQARHTKKQEPHRWHYPCLGVSGVKFSIFVPFLSSLEKPQELPTITRSNVYCQLCKPHKPLKRRISR